VLGPGINWKGNLRGSGGVRIEGAFEGDITLRGLVVVGESGRVTCENLRANSVIVAGTVNGCITAEKLDIRSTGRVWGDVVVVALATEEGAFLRGQVRMEEKIEIPAETETEISGGSGEPTQPISTD
jgi:cytoskeletal protein CcmA (bactofilin family)